MFNKINNNIYDRVLKQNDIDAINQHIEKKFEVTPNRVKNRGKYESAGQLKTILHSISGTVATIGLAALLAFVLGIDFNLSAIMRDGLTKNTIILIGFILIGGFAFYKIETLKAALLEDYKRDKKMNAYTDKSDFQMGMGLAVVNVGLSLFGAFILTNAVLNTKGTDAMNAVIAEYQPQIDQLTAENQNTIQKLEAEAKEAKSGNYKNRQGKILYKQIPVIAQKEKSLQAARDNFTSSKASLMAAFNQAKEEVKAKHGLDAAMTTDPDQNILIIAAMGGFQILIELGIIFLIAFRVNYEYKAHIEIEAEKASQGIPPAMQAPQPQPQPTASTAPKPLDLTKEGMYSSTNIQIKPEQLNKQKQPLQMKQITVPTRHGDVTHPPSKVRQMILASMKKGNFDRAEVLFENLYQGLNA